MKIIWTFNINRIETSNENRIEETVKDLVYSSLSYEDEETCKHNAANLLALLTQKLVDADMISAEELRQAIETNFYQIED